MHVEATDQWSYHNNPCLEGVIKVTDVIFIHEHSIELKPIADRVLSGNKDGFGFSTKIRVLGVGAEMLLIEPH